MIRHPNEICYQSPQRPPPTSGAQDTRQDATTRHLMVLVHRRYNIRSRLRISRSPRSEFGESASESQKLATDTRKSVARVSQSGHRQKRRRRRRRRGTFLSRCIYSRSPKQILLRLQSFHSSSSSAIKPRDRYRRSATSHQGASQGYKFPDNG